MSELWNKLEPLTKSVVKDQSLAEQGKFTLEMAMAEFPGLRNLLKEYEHEKPLQGVRVSGCLHLTADTMCMIEALVRLGAKVRWASSNPFSPQDDACAACAELQEGKACIFGWKGETLEEYIYFVYQALVWPDQEGPQLMVDDGCIAYSMLFYGCQLEERLERGEGLFDLGAVDQADRDMICLLRFLNHAVPQRRGIFRKMAAGCIGVSEETTSGVTQYRNFYKKHGLMFPVMSTNDSVTKHKYDNIYGCRHSSVHGLMNGAEHFLTGGKTAVVIGYGNVGKGVVQGLSGLGARVKVTEADPICALQAAMDGYEVVLMEDVVRTADIFITTTGGIDCITLEHMRQMKDNAILGNIGQGDREIQMVELESMPGIVVKPLNRSSDKYIFPDTRRGVIVLARGRLYNLGCAFGHPSFVMSASFTNQTMCLLELYRNRDKAKYDKKIHKLPKILDERVARYHLDALGVRLTRLTQKQCDFLGISPEGPFKEDDYHY